MVVRAALLRGRLRSIPSAIGQSLAYLISQSHTSFSVLTRVASIEEDAPQGGSEKGGREGGREGGRGPKAPLGSRWQLALLHPVVFPVGSRARLARFPVVSALRYLSRRRPRLDAPRLVCASSCRASPLSRPSSPAGEGRVSAGWEQVANSVTPASPGAYPIRICPVSGSLSVQFGPSPRRRFETSCLRQSLRR